MTEKTKDYDDTYYLSTEYDENGPVLDVAEHGELLETLNSDSDNIDNDYMVTEEERDMDLFIRELEEARYLRDKQLEELEREQSYNHTCTRLDPMNDIYLPDAFIKSLYVHNCPSIIDGIEEIYTSINISRTVIITNDEPTMLQLRDQLQDRLHSVSAIKQNELDDERPNYCYKIHAFNDGSTRILIMSKDVWTDIKRDLGSFEFIDDITLLILVNLSNKNERTMLNDSLLCETEYVHVA